MAMRPYLTYPGRLRYDFFSVAHFHKNGKMKNGGTAKRSKKRRPVRALSGVKKPCWSRSQMTPQKNNPKKASTMPGTMGRRLAAIGPGLSVRRTARGAVSGEARAGFASSVWAAGLGKAAAVSAGRGFHCAMRATK